MKSAPVILLKTLYAPFYHVQGKTWEKEVDECKECLKIALRIVIAVGDFIFLKKIFMQINTVAAKPLRLPFIHPNLSAISVYFGLGFSYLLLILGVSKLDSQSSSFALAFLTGRVALHYYHLSPSGSRVFLAAFFAMGCFTFLHVADERAATGLLSRRIDSLCEKLAPYMARLCSYREKR